MMTKGELVGAVSSFPDDIELMILERGAAQTQGEMYGIMAIGVHVDSETGTKTLFITGDDVSDTPQYKNKNN